jgi:hypothetical protein
MEGERLMSRQAEAIKRKVREGALVPSPTPREFTIAVGPSAPPPQVGDVWLLRSAAYVVSEVHGVGSIRVGKLRRLIEPEDVPKTSA